MNALPRKAVTLIVVLLALLAGWRLWHFYMIAPWTRDARVRADVVTIAPDVSGWVTELAVEDTAFVERGERLFKINQSRYRAALEEAQARVAQREAQLELKRHEERRRSRLSRQAISSEAREIARIDTRIAEANLEQAEADLQSARLDLERTTVQAPAAGHILNLQLHEGNYATAGKPVMALVKANSFYVTGYFEETKMPHIEIGDPARVILMSGDIHLRGHVAGIGRGIANPNTIPDNQLLPQVQPTFNWVRLAQRIPVRIALDETPKQIPLSAGMTATVRILDSTE